MVVERELEWEKKSESVCVKEKHHIAFHPSEEAEIGLVSQEREREQTPAGITTENMHTKTRK